MKAVLVGILVLFGVLVFGFIAPALISEDDSLAVILGFTTILVYLNAAYIVVFGFIVPKPEKEKS